jgi:glyceraldehyde 3-phosphate dehydrogenase
VSQVEETPACLYAPSAVARVGINGFGRIGRLALRAAWDWPELEFTHINETGGDAATAAHLLTFDSVHGRWSEDISGEGATLTVRGAPLSYSSAGEPGEVPWGELGVDLPAPGADSGGSDG